MTIRPITEHYVNIKPKLVFFQRRYDDSVPEFLMMHVQAHVKCLSEFFNITVIREDCDYLQVCDTHEPDLTLFESGPNLATCHRLKITNIHAHPRVPKLGLLNADAWSETRAGTLSEMEHWGIETFFSIAVTAAEHTPAIAENLFCWPNFVDTEIYRDYGQDKVIPVLFTGAQASQYPWRAKIYRLVSQSFPTLFSPHPKYYRADSTAGITLHGEQYARTINASWCVPTCGTVAKEVVRKHFEIPACKACLITEKSPALEAAGFVDMVNCVFADEHDILDKLAYLFRNSRELETITQAGHDLVRSRHTAKQRDQILRWLNLYVKLKPNEKIIQRNPFDAPTVVKNITGVKNPHIISNGLHLALFHHGDEMLWAGKYEQAERLYLRCLSYTRMLPEPMLRLTLCQLYKGNAKMALSWILPPIQYTLAGYKSIDPDPVEWAWFIISLLCLGQNRKAIKRASQFPWVHHPELDRTRWAIGILKNKRGVETLPHHGKEKPRSSIHQLPTRGLDEWVQQLCIMLKACERHDMAELLIHYVSTRCPSKSESGISSSLQNSSPETNKVALNGKCLERPPGVLGKGNAVVRLDDPIIYFRIRQKWGNLRRTVTSYVLTFLHRIETKSGGRLPFQFSQMKKDECFSAISKLARDEDFRTALIIGAAFGDGSTKAFLAGVVQNENKPSVFCLNAPVRRSVNPRQPCTDNPMVKCYRFQITSPAEFDDELDAAVKKIKAENQIACFEVVLVDTSALAHQLPITAELNEVMKGAKLVMLNGINTFYTYKTNCRLLKDPDYDLLAYNPDLHNGYAIFKKKIYKSVNQ